MIKDDEKDLKDSTKCWVCKKAYEEGDVKVKYCDNITEKY